MVSQFTQQQQQAPPQTTYQNLSPAQWAQLNQLAQSQPQTGYQPLVAAPNTSAYTSDGTMSAIDPALLQSQWLQYQQSQLSQSAIIPQSPQYAPQYAPQQAQGDFVSNNTIEALGEFIQSSGIAAGAAKDYIQLLESLLIEHRKLISFSAAQDDLIWKFLHDRDFALQYARYSWIQDPVDDKFASDLADTYLEIAALSPYQRSLKPRDPQFMGSNVNLATQVLPTPPLQNSIPPLPSSNGNINNGITMEQYLIAQQQGLVGAARAAAMQNPASLYASLFQ